MMETVINYDPKCRPVLNNCYMVDINELEDGDLIPVNTLILINWMKWGNA